MLLPTVFSSGWASGVSGYLAVLQLGVLGRFFGADSVPDALMRTDVMVVAGLLYAIEFVTDKIPYVDNIWDAIHTVIRPTIGAMLGLLVAGEADTLAQAVAATAGGLTALASHLCKAAARLVINISPEPLTNITASVGEDLSVASVIALLVVSPWTAAAVAGVLFAAGLFVVWRVHRLIRRGLARLRALHAQP
ncbi:MAG: DUF4126 domain-containing protein [Ilumatobacteraceae bacterium]